MEDALLYNIWETTECALHLRFFQGEFLHGMQEGIQVGTFRWPTHSSQSAVAFWLERENEGGGGE